MSEARPAWRIHSLDLKNLRGMIIDRNAAWRRDPKWSKTIDTAIRKGIENIDQGTFGHINGYLWHGGLPGTYETRGLNEAQMEEAWRAYLDKHGYA